LPQQQQHNFVKNQMRNHMTDEWLNNCLVIYVWRDTFVGIKYEKIIQCFLNMANRRGQLWCIFMLSNLYIYGAPLSKNFGSVTA